MHMCMLCLKIVLGWLGFRALAHLHAHRRYIDLISKKTTTLHTTLPICIYCCSFVAAPKLVCPEKVEGDLNKDVTIECTLTANSAITDIQWTRFNRGDVVGDNEENDILGLKSTVSQAFL